MLPSQPKVERRTTVYLTTAKQKRFRTVAITLLTLSLGNGLVMSSRAQSNTVNPDKDAIHPYKVSIAERDLVDLRRRIAETRWPDKETVADQSQGVQLAKLQD